MPAHEVARAFDSNEATMRLAAMTVTSDSQTVPPGGPPPAEPGGWGWRDTLILALAALAGVLAGLWLR